MSDMVNSYTMDKTVLTIVALSEMSDDTQYWAARKPAERLAAMELMRAINYGYDAATTRLQRFLEVAPLRED